MKQLRLNERGRFRVRGRNTARIQPRAGALTEWNLVGWDGVGAGRTRNEDHDGKKYFRFSRVDCDDDCDDTGALAGQSVAGQDSTSACQCTPSNDNGTKTAAGEPVAIVAGQAIYQRDLDDLVESQMLSLRNQEYQIKSRGLEDLIRQRLVEAEAKKQGLTTEELYAKEVDSRIATPSDGEVAAYYLGLKSQIKAPLQDIKMQLQANLKAIEVRQARQDYADSLRSKGDVAVLLMQPRVEVAVDRGRLRGDPNALVTIVEFADYQCPYCKQTETTLNNLLRKYPGQVKLAFRDFPLASIHPYAEEAAEAARCAGKRKILGVPRRAVCESGQVRPRTAEGDRSNTWS